LAFPDDLRLALLVFGSAPGYDRPKAGSDSAFVCGLLPRRLWS
jgi:hypothetical protein